MLLFCFSLYCVLVCIEAITLQMCAMASTVSPWWHTFDNTVNSRAPYWVIAPYHTSRLFWKESIWNPMLIHILVYRAPILIFMNNRGALIKLYCSFMLSEGFSLLMLCTLVVLLHNEIERCTVCTHVWFGTRDGRGCRQFLQRLKEKKLFQAAPI